MPDLPAEDRQPGAESSQPEESWEPAGAPRWVKTFGLVVLGLVLVFLVLQLFGIGGEHGPGRHG